MLLAVSFPLEAQQVNIPRVGVITSGGLWYSNIEGLRAGLKQLGFEEGKHFTLDIRETKGDLKAAEEAGRSLEQRESILYTQLKPLSRSQQSARPKTLRSFS